VLQEFAGLVDFHLDVVFAGLGADADLFQLLLMGFGLGALAGLLVTELAVIEDLADRWPFVRRDLDQVQVRLTGQVEGLRGWDNSELFAAGADEADRADPDLLVDTLTPILLRVAVVDTLISFREKGARFKKGSGTFCRNGPEGASHKRGLSPFWSPCFRETCRGRHLVLCV